MLLILLLYATMTLSTCQSQDYSSVATYIAHLTNTDLSHANVLIADGQDYLANQVLEKLSLDIQSSVAIANFYQPIGKGVNCIFQIRPRWKKVLFTVLPLGFWAILGKNKKYQ